MLGCAQTDLLALVIFDELNPQNVCWNILKRGSEVAVLIYVAQYLVVDYSFVTCFYGVITDRLLIG